MVAAKDASKASTQHTIIQLLYTYKLFVCSNSIKFETSRLDTYNQRVVYTHSKVIFRKYRMIQRGDGDGGNGFANKKGDEETAKIENKRCVSIHLPTQHTCHQKNIRC